MTEHNQIPNSGGAQSVKMLLAMVGISVICAFFISLTFESTYDRIESNKAIALKKAVFEVMDGIQEKRSFHFDGNKFIQSNGEEVQTLHFHAGYDDRGNMSGIAIEATGMGYADIIKILYAYNPRQEEIIGFKVLESKETPGLGDKIEKEDFFLANFEHLDVSLNEELRQLKNKIVTVKQGTKNNEWEVDGITGATISSKAIGNIIWESGSKWIPIIFERKDDFQLNTEE